MSAAVPWIGMLTATRSAAARIWPLRLVSSGTRTPPAEQRLHHALLARVARACSSMKPRTRGKPAK
jgi:hypothetical protein